MKVIHPQERRKINKLLRGNQWCCSGQQRVLKPCANANKFYFTESESHYKVFTLLKTFQTIISSYKLRISLCNRLEKRRMKKKKKKKHLFGLRPQALIVQVLFFFFNIFKNKNVLTNVDVTARIMMPET